MNFFEWLRSSIRHWLGLDVPTPAPPVVPTPSPAPVIAPRVPPVVAPSPVDLIAPKPVILEPSKPIPPRPVPPVAPRPVVVPQSQVGSGSFGRGTFGVSHVHSPAHSVSMEVLNRVAPVQANHIMGFATGNPWPRRNGPFEWGDIDGYINRMKGAKMTILVANSAPGWMMESGRDYDMDGRLKREFFGEYAKLVVAYLARFPWIKAVVVWNEFKSFGKLVNGRFRWDYEEYTEFYNIVYDAVKAVRSDVLVGGPYMVLDTYSTSNQSDPSSIWRGAWGVGDQRVLDSYEGWRRRARGFDWVGFDFGPNHRDRESLFTDSRCLDKMLDFMKWCRTWTQKPLICMETYPDPKNGVSLQHTREMYVALLERMRTEIAGESAALIWNEQGFRPSLDVELVAVLDQSVAKSQSSGSWKA